MAIDRSRIYARNQAGGIYDTNSPDVTYTAEEVDAAGYQMPGNLNGPLMQKRSQAAPAPQMSQPKPVTGGLGAAPAAPLPHLPSGGDGGSVGGGSMPTMGYNPPAAPATPEIQKQAMAGLQSAGDNTPAAAFKGSAMGGVNPNLGRRNLPDEISALKVLTY